jgi:transcriptional regulator with XRE-family HTH domain
METETGRLVSDPTRHPISHALREAIAARGLTASALARAAGVDPGVIKRYLDGRRGLTLATADKLSAALNLRLVDLDMAGRIDREEVTPRRPSPRPRRPRQSAGSRRDRRS